MNSELLLKVRTVEEKEKLKAEIAILLNGLYKEKGEGFFSALKTQVRYWVSEVVKEEAGHEPANIENYLKTVDSNLDRLKVLNLTVAFEPTDSSIDKIIQSIRNNGVEDVILNFIYEPKNLGGAIVSYEGEYRDLTLKRLYDVEYKEQEAEVLKIMYSK